MNEDYLWDKTGGDPEIERLENALRAYAYAETAAPAVENKILAFKSKPPRKIFGFKFAAAACLVFAAAALGILMLMSSGKSTTENESARATAPETVSSIAANNQKQDDSAAKSPTEKPLDFGAGKSSVAPTGKIEKPLRAAENESLKIARIVSADNRPRRLKPAFVRAATPKVRLTDEERFAYDQLMLALSVTSSKLKLVRNKIEGREEKTVVKSSFKDGR